jgi:hypothetical protein
MTPDRDFICISDRLLNQNDLLTTAITLVHEMIHVGQYRQRGTDNFKCEYSKQYVRCNYQDDRNSLEHEAYEFQRNVATPTLTSLNDQAVGLDQSRPMSPTYLLIHGNQSVGETVPDKILIAAPTIHTLPLRPPPYVMNSMLELLLCAGTAGLLAIRMGRTSMRVRARPTGVRIKLPRRERVRAEPLRDPCGRVLSDDLHNHAEASSPTPVSNSRTPKLFCSAHCRNRPASDCTGDRIAGRMASTAPAPSRPPQAIWRVPLSARAAAISDRRGRCNGPDR